MHNNRKALNKFTLPRDESGAVAVYYLLIFTVLCGFGGLAVDYGNLVRVRAEVQRTADAAALAGAAGLVPYTGTAPTQTPNWTGAITKAQTLVSNVANKADSLPFAAGEGAVDYGYWLLAPPTGSTQTLPKARPTTAAYLPEPAIQVSLNRNVSLYLAPLVGVTSPKTVSATATAILPEGYGTSGIPPVAVSWDTVYNPDPTHPGTYIIDVLEQDVKPQSNKGVAGWININGGNSVPSVRIDANMVADPSGVATGSLVYAVPGTKATLTDYMAIGDTIVIPVVQDVSKMEWMPILEWAAFKIDAMSANSMTGHFVTPWFDPNVKPVPYTGATIGTVAGTPKLVSP
jgi:Flp pilus assembly protein TadG